MLYKCVQIKTLKVHKGKAARREVAEKRDQRNQGDTGNETVDSLCRDVSHGLLDSFESGRLEQWLKDGGLKGQVPPTAPTVAWFCFQSKSMKGSDIATLPLFI